MFSTLLGTLSSLSAAPECPKRCLSRCFTQVAPSLKDKEAETIEKTETQFRELVPERLEVQ